jgi:hypothetical protein
MREASSLARSVASTDGCQIGVRTAARLELQGQQLAVPTDHEQLVVELVHQLSDVPGVLLCVHPSSEIG